MATKTKTAAADSAAEAQQELPTVEELKISCKTPDAVYNGVIAAQGWHRGKQITEAEYVKAVSTWNKSPVGRRRK